MSERNHGDGRSAPSEDHEVQTVAKGHEVQVYCPSGGPLENDSKWIVSVSNPTHTIAGKVEVCPICGASLDPSERYWVDGERFIDKEASA